METFQLHHFDGFFHVFASLNLAYAGFKDFSSYMDERIVAIARILISTLRGYVASTRSKLTLLNAETLNIPKLDAKIDTLCNKADRINHWIDSQLDLQLHFRNGFKSTFIIATLYALGILFLSGWQQTIGLERLENVLFIMHFSSIYIIVVFFRSFTHLRNTLINNLWPIGVIATTLAIMYVYIKFCPVAHEQQSVISLVTSVGLAQFIVVSPYILHLFRILIGVAFLWLLSLIVRLYLLSEYSKIKDALDYLNK